VIIFFMVLLPFAIKHPEPTAQGKQRHPKLKFQHSSGHSPNKTLQSLELTESLLGSNQVSTSSPASLTFDSWNCCTMHQ
jgi:hypothetical protein